MHAPAQGTAARTKATLTLFESEYNKLNPAQRRAVDTIEGPVMVIAGPGTGKTQTVAMRVANILRRTQMRPSNILCLTFSVSGATAMRDRLRLLIDADAYGVTVSTIHGFAQSIIDQHPTVFGEWSVREQLGDLEKYQILNGIIDQLSSSSALINPKDPYEKDSDILSRISQVKREGKTEADLERVADEFERQMQGKSREGTKAHQKNLLAARKFRDFVEIFRRYQAALQEKQRYDYDDMILSVLRAFGEETGLLQSLQERYQYVLVDEFQDTNGAQWGLIDRLTSYETLAHDPNLFVVGDDDQAIYRFQGANIANMLSFRDRFPAAPVIPLTVSYRSTQGILDAAERLIGHNTERLVGRLPGLEKHLVAVSGEPGVVPLLHRTPSDQAEPWFIADLIDDRLRTGMPPEQIAVLTRTNDELFPLYDTLRSRGIPVLLRGKKDLLTHPLVAQALAILSAVDHPGRDSALAAGLACDCFGLHPADLSRIHGFARENDQSILRVLESFDWAEEPKLTDRAGVIRARDIILSLHQKIPIRTVLDTIEHLLRECGLIPTADDAAKDPLDLAAIESFFSFVKARCLERPAYTFREFRNDIGFYADPLYGQARLTYELPHLVTSGVQLLTAHQSKGQEFHTVILANFRDGHWDKRKKSSGIALPEELLFGWEKETLAYEQNQDERRLAFVAMTRARAALIFVCPRELTVGEKSRPMAPSAFFAEAGPLPESDATLRDAAAASLLLRPAVRVLDEELRAHLRERLEHFALSATTLRRFLHDPQEFLRIDLLRQPEQLDETSIRRLGYGSAVHWALRQWATAASRRDPFGADAFIDAFHWYLREKTILTEAQRQDLLSLGREALPLYFQARLEGTVPFLHAVERDYRARFGDIALKGKIDRIDLASPTSGHATIIDYKTGRPKSETAIRGSLDPGVVSRGDDGDYFRQLAFYALLLEQADPLLQPQAFVLDFIGERGEDPIQRSFVVSGAEKDDLRTLIRDVWAKIQALEFTPL
ncbi:MAG: DNA helicase II / ATP-dependent DNA helicase PcrA [Candidatus Peregrinibacteria bacterium Greene0416_19]|nr:MAG: DNA helicase II / ATP-dependent DNA helicase PcrA [Candidatus Peregrinibacteria bacterium Greene0416_19]